MATPTEVSQSNFPDRQAANHPRSSRYAVWLISESRRARPRWRYSRFLCGCSSEEAGGFPSGYDHGGVARWSGTHADCYLFGCIGTGYLTALRPASARAEKVLEALEAVGNMTQHGDPQLLCMALQKDCQMLFFAHICSQGNMASLSFC